MAQKVGDKALVTGASSGIGEAFAAALAARASDLILVARREDRLRDLAVRLHKTLDVDVQVLQADLADSADLARVEVALRSGGVDVLINNAGFGANVAFVDLPPDRMLEMLRVKVEAPTRLARAALPSMLAKGSGTIINVASLLAFSGALQGPQFPLRATYAAANSYLVTFSQILQAEVGSKGVRVQALCPMLVRTDFHRIQGRDISGVPNIVEPHEIVRGSLAGLELGEVICFPTGGDPSAVGAWNGAAARFFASNQGALADRYQTNQTYD
jgi:short-subunit dehydrogenase